MKNLRRLDAVDQVDRKACREQGGQADAGCVGGIAAVSA
jgi:hypothetical protein